MLNERVTQERVPVSQRSTGRIRWMPDGTGVLYIDTTGRNLMVLPFDGRPP
jgi:hypothetical protein